MLAPLEAAVEEAAAAAEEVELLPDLDEDPLAAEEVPAAAAAEEVEEESESELLEELRHEVSEPALTVT